MEEQKSQSADTAERLLGDLRHSRRTHGSAITGSVVRSASQLAVRSTLWVGRGGSHLVRDAAEGAVHAVGEIGSETKAFVRDAIIGVVEGTDQVITITKPAVREVVVGAVRGASKSGMGANEIGRDAVEAAIVGAAAVGINSKEAAAAAVDGAVEALAETGDDLAETAKAAVAGVVSGVSAAGGDVAAAVQDSAERLIAHAVGDERELEEIAGTAGGVVEAALEEAHSTLEDTEHLEEVLAAAAAGVVETAYKVDQAHGDTVREEVIRTISQPRRHLAPEVQRQLHDVAERLSEELPRGRATWRVAAMYRAARHLIRAGAPDLAGALAYFAVLSLFPLLALIIIVAAWFVEPATVQERVLGVVAHYFPASSELFRDAMESLIDNSASIGVIALVTILLAATGLFRAASRAANRTFGLERPATIRGSVAEGVVATVLGVLFVGSVGVAVLCQAVIGIGGEFVAGSEQLPRILVIVLGAASAALPAGVTGIVFTIAYHYTPHKHVEWRDAAFGGMAAVILFEAGKHLFLWVTGLVVQREIVYGPVASTVMLLLWAYVAGLIFLYGASLTKASSEMRPRIRTGTEE